MRVALVADLHGNAVGLDAVVAEIVRDEFDEVVCLGDVAQGGPQPVETVDRLRELGWRCVFGNSDEFLLTLDPGSEQLDEERLARLLAVGRWSADRLGPERLELLRAYEPTVELDLAGRRLVCCHATPASNEDVILPDTPRDAVETALADADVVACGHVHLQWHRRIGRKIWFSAGSAGLVYEHTEPMSERPYEPWAEYAVLAADPAGALRLEFRRVPYDVEAVLAATHASGVPDAEHFASQWQRA